MTLILFIHLISSYGTEMLTSGSYASKCRCATSCWDGLRKRCHRRRGMGCCWCTLACDTRDTHSKPEVNLLKSHANSSHTLTNHFLLFLPNIKPQCFWNTRHKANHSIHHPNPPLFAFGDLQRPLPRCPGAKPAAPPRTRSRPADLQRKIE